MKTVAEIRQRKDLLVEDFLEDVLETAIIALEDGVLGAHVQRPALLQCVLETGVGESCDGLAKAVKASVQNISHKQNCHSLAKIVN